MYALSYMSINNEHVQNVQEASLITLLTVNDRTLANSLVPININITKEMMTNIKFSRQSYKAALE